MNDRFTTGAILAAVGLIAFVGCSERGPHTIPVYGTVNFVGREAPKVCNLYFQPIKVEGISRPATSQRGPDGAYAVKAFQNSKGLIPGTYGVRVYYYDLKPGANPALDAQFTCSLEHFLRGRIAVAGNIHKLFCHHFKGQMGREI